MVDDRAVDPDWIELHVLQAEFDMRDIPKGLLSEDTYTPPFPEV
jgi:hypothetical protein